jgi:glycosyltransferase involved in cell wall biosynthesis
MVRSGEYSLPYPNLNIPELIVPSASVIICTRNRVESLRATLDSAAGLDVPEGISAELIVVDNGSTDGTAAAVRSAVLPNMPVRLISEPQPGLSAARNAGLAAARGDILIFTDDDVRFNARWIECMTRPIIEKRADAVSGGIILHDSLLRPWMLPMHRVALGSTEFMDERAPGAMFGANFALSRSVLDRVPKFDEELGAGALGAGEETLFAWQLQRAGCRLAGAFDAPVAHVSTLRHLTRESFLRSARSIGRSLSYIDYHWRHLPAAAWRHPGIPSVRMTLLLYRARLAMLRRLRSSESSRADGVAPWEYTWVKRIARVEYYLQLVGEPYKYEQFGLVKKTR